MRALAEAIILLWAGVDSAWRLFFRSELGKGRWERWPLWIAVMTTAIILLVVLNRWADPAVTDPASVNWLLVFVAGGALWLWLAACSFNLLNLSIAQDALAGRNRAAIWASSGAILGAGLVYCGANVGSGDEALTTVYSAVLGYAVWLACWVGYEVIADISESIVIERATGAGLRLGLLLIVNGLILFRAIAGDWISPQATWDDLVAKGWPAPAVTLAMALGELGLRKTRP